MAIENRGTTDAPLVDKASGILIALAMVFANAANYGFQIVCGRLLTVEEYGLLAGFMSVVTVITVATSALQTTAARAVAAEENEPGGPFIDGLTRSSFVIAAIMLVVTVIVSPMASRFFNIGTLPLILLGVYVAPSALDSIAVGRLQGLQRFRAMAFYSTAQASAKLALASILLAAGLRATGLVAGLILSSGLVAIIGTVASREAGSIGVHAFAPDVRRAFAAFTMLWFVLGADVLFARAFFVDTAAGLYGAAAVLGKAVLWIPAVVAQLLFPRLAKRSKHGESVAGLALRAVSVVAVVVFCSVTVLWAFGDTVFRVLYGERYVGAADTAWKIGLAVAPLALVNLLIVHFLARGQGHFLGWMVVVLVGEVAALYLGPKTDDFYATVLAASGVALLVLMVPSGAWRRETRRLLRRHQVLSTG